MFWDIEIKRFLNVFWIHKFLITLLIIFAIRINLNCWGNDHMLSCCNNASDFDSSPHSDSKPFLSALVYKFSYRSTELANYSSTQSVQLLS